ncbi:MAG: metalloregulator ArsR/SmtB family transcription factor [Arenimonas sp.]|jgi:DNA-binding transcriptional ArsR family regulator
MNKRKSTLEADPMTRMQRHACEASLLLKAMGNEQRLLVLCNLVGNELSVGELQAKLRLSQSALSQHLAVLREAGMVETRRSAQTIFYSLPPGPVHQLMHALHDIYCGDTE